ncbi:MAG: PEGA domain-containing protein [Pseudomonadota bacterium]
MKKSLYAISALILLPACATVTRGTNVDMIIESNPSEADIRLSTGQTCITPCTLKMPRKNGFNVMAKKEGYKTYEGSVDAKLSGGGGAGFVGNALIGGVIGAGVDVASGAMNDLVPNPLIITLEPEDSELESRDNAPAETPETETSETEIPEEENEASPEEKTEAGV